MDKYEFRISLQEINKLITEQRFDEASSIADTIDWTRVKSAETLCKISDVYKINGEYEKSRSVLALANTRDPRSADIIYSLCELTIYLYGRDGLQSDLTSALSLLTNYQTLQPANPKRLILQYKFYNVSSVSLREKIDVLERLKEEKYSARWGYELAALKHEAGDDEAAVSECRSVINNFGGKYAVKAQDLLSRIMEGGSAAAAPLAGKEAADHAANRTEAVPEREPVQQEVPVQEEPESTATEDISVSKAQENQALDASLRRNVASGMKDIYARPFEEKIAQEPGGQYVMVQEEKAEEEKQTEGQLSISEVMKEWEKIRGNIRHANDQKRLQKMMEDTGPIMQDFDETAKHGLLEDIEKNVARNQRYAKTMVYRDASGSSYRVAPRREYGYEDQEPEQYDQRYDQAEQAYDSYDPYEQRYEDAAYPAEEPYAYEDAPGYQDGYEAPYEEGAPENYDEEYQEPAADVTAQEEPVEDEPVSEEPEETPAEQEEAPEEQEEASEEPEEAPAEQEAAEVPEDEDEDIRIAPARDNEATRMWDGKSVRRAAEIRRAVKEAQDRMEAEEKEELPAEYDPAASQAEPEEPVVEPAEQEPEGSEAPAEEYAQEPEQAEEYPEEETEAPEEYPEEYSKEYEEAGEPAGEVYEETEPAEEPEPEQEEPAAEEYSREPARAREHEKMPEQHRAAHGNRVLTPEERKMFGPFCVVKENRQQLLAALDKISLASWTGNVIITGGEATARRVAQGILEIERKSDSNFTGKIARASAQALSKLSRQKLEATLAQIENGAMIVEGAAGLAKETLVSLYHQLEDREHGLIVILLDTRKAMDEFTAAYEEYLGSFNARIDIKALNDKALVSYGLEYALSKDYSIDEFGQMALSSRIASMQTPDHHVTMKEVREIVDEAISYASKKSPKTMVDVITRKRYDKDDRIIIHEKDFQHF